MFLPESPPVLKRSLQVKVAATFIAFMAIMVALLFIYQQQVLLPVYSALEREFVARDLERAVQSIRHEEMGLAAHLEYWSSWDDTYEFAIDRNEDYVSENLVLWAFVNLRFNVIFIYDNQGDVIWGGALEPGENTWSSMTEFPPEGPSTIAGLSMPGSTPSEPARSGLTLTEKGPLLVASRPILNSHGEGDPRGTFVIGRLLTGENLEKLQQLSGMSFELIPATQLPQQHKALSLTNADAAENAFFIDEQNLTTLVAWRALKDFHGQRSVLIKASISRDIFQAGYQGLRSGIGLMVATLLALMLGLMSLVHIEVVRPIVRIVRHLVRLRLKGQYDQPIEYSRNDELGRLMRSLNELFHQVAEQSSQLKDLSYVDSLTGVANRRCFNEKLQHFWQHCAAQQLDLAVILCDIDDFKRYNDLYGHLEGDKCLREVAQALQRAANKKDDLVARFGGEEFAILLPTTNLLEAINVAERLCSTIEALHIEHQGSRVHQWITVTLGVAAIIPSPEGEPEQLLHAADKALYRAKALGRNRVASGAMSSRRLQ